AARANQNPGAKMHITRGRTSAALSLCIHACGLALLLLIGVYNPPREAPPQKRDFIPLAPLRLPRAFIQREGGGGGGNHSLTPASKGHPRKPAHRIFIAPMLVAQNLRPKLVIEPAMKLSENLTPPLPVIGIPTGVSGPPSSGPGDGGGIGRGHGPGPGDGNGPGDDGYGGPGAGGRPRITPPVLVWKCDPEYSEEARKAKYQGIVMLRVDIGVDGRPQNVRVDEPLGLGLDEKAIEAVRTWK